MYTPRIKICGLSDEPAVAACVEAEVDFLGFVFYEKSPRYVSYQRAGALVQSVPESVQCVGLFVNPDDQDIARALQHVRVDMIQLHGDEPPARVSAVKALCGVPVMKALPVATAEDLAGIEAYEAAADWLLFDTKTGDPQNFGGSGHAFDWHLLAGRALSKPWMLAGGLAADTVQQALSIVQPAALDVSSGVEDDHVRGLKDPVKIKEFVNAVREGAAPL